MSKRRDPLQMPMGLPKEKQSSWQRFREFLKNPKLNEFLKDSKLLSKGLDHLSKLEVLSKYKNTLGNLSTAANAFGYGKVQYAAGHKHTKGSKMLHDIHMRGGDWNSFVNWVKGAASTVGNAIKTGATKAWDYIKNKPATAAGMALKGLSYIPSPLSGALSTAGTAVGAIGSALGKGQAGGFMMMPPLMPQAIHQPYHRALPAMVGGNLSDYDMLNASKSPVFW